MPLNKTNDHKKRKYKEEGESSPPLLRTLDVSFLFQAAVVSIGIHNQVIKDLDA